MEDSMAEKKHSRAALICIFTGGGLVAIWCGAAFLGALRMVNWQVGELARQYMLATGLMKPLRTLVDFYTHIKGVEYIICVAFFVAFPVFVRYINTEKKSAPAIRR